MIAPGDALMKRGGHKYDHGHVLIIAGGPGHGGAARLAARAALRIGAGLVTLAPPGAAMGEHAGPPDALMRQALDDAADFPALITARRIGAVVLGPGAGIARAAALLPGVLASGLPAVIDADAITALARAPLPLHAGIVLTPHEGEFARLCPDLAASLTVDPDNRITAAQKAAARLGATVLLKGPETAIATPDGRTALNRAGDAPMLATAGSGDVLAGLIAGLLARGFTPGPAAATAAHLHSLAGRAFGPGLIADDLPEMIPAILRGMG
ncbi:MAG: NAD(P)H-hydrate dehydratase [Paracoccus sp. (in: a-proteobacteria)]|nr:NAD(P)H-hydrate dehydratase [Paracoccus sp. (in: a-proteobacteria)]